MNGPSKTTTQVAEDHGRAIFIATETGHTPFNKRSWEVEQSTAVLKVNDYDGKKAVNPKAWTEISLEETTQAKEGGPFQTRTITFYLHGDDRRALIEMLGGRL